MPGARPARSRPRRHDDVRGAATPAPRSAGADHVSAARALAADRRTSRRAVCRASEVADAGSRRDERRGGCGASGGWAAASCTTCTKSKRVRGVAERRRPEAKTCRGGAGLEAGRRRPGERRGGDRRRPERRREDRRRGSGGCQARPTLQCSKPRVRMRAGSQRLRPSKMRGVRMRLFMRSKSGRR